MQLVISGADKHCYLRLNPVDPLRSEAGQMLMRLVDLLVRRSDEARGGSSGTHRLRDA